MRTLPWLFAKLQSRGRAYAAGQGMSLWRLSPGFVSPAGARGEKSAAMLAPSTSPAGNPATGGGPGTPPLTGGQLAVAQHHPLPATLLLGSQWPSSTQRSVGLQEKGEISMRVPVPFGPSASRSHNSPFLCAVLMPLLFLISSHYVDLTFSAFPGQK